MKKITSILVLSLVLSVLALTAQVSPMSVKAPGPMNRDAQYSCLDNSLYSQLPAPLEAGWFADDGTFSFQSSG